MKKSCYKKNIKENEDIIPEFSSGSSTPVVSQQEQQASKTLKPVQGLSNKNICAFTLIEMLVVVLIIGILSAIALPQYQRAVTKARGTNLQTVLAEVVRASNAYYLQYRKWPTSFSQLDLKLRYPRLTGTWESQCGSNLVRKDTLKGEDFEISLYNGGIGQRYRIFAYFTKGPYKCRGFIHILDHNDERWNAKVNHKTFCGEDIYHRACGATYCEEGLFCKDKMGKKLFQKNLSTIDLYN